MEVSGRRGRRRKNLLVGLKEKETIMEIERWNTRSHSVENCPWYRLWTCREMDNRFNEMCVFVEGGINISQTRTPTKRELWCADGGERDDYCWDVTPCVLTNVYPTFGMSTNLHLHGGQLKSQAGGTVDISVNVCLTWLITDIYYSIRPHFLSICPT
jgi:hypothetical protein